MVAYALADLSERAPASSRALTLVKRGEIGMYKIRISNTATLTPDYVLRAFWHALELARGYEGATAPNPPMGYVLLDTAAQVIAVGAHRRAGLPNAEAEAIATAHALDKADAVDTVVVTLGPCYHFRLSNLSRGHRGH